MKERWKKISRVAGAVIVLVIIYQLIWPIFYSSLINLNRYPTAEYFRIMWFLSPNGLSAITVMLGCVVIAWMAYVYR